MGATLGTGSIVEPLTGRRIDPAGVRRAVAARVRRYRAAGLAPGDRVFLLYGNRIEFFADLLAVWQAGACAVPIDARLTPFAVETLAKTARPAAAIHAGGLDADLAGRLAARRIEILDTHETADGEDADLERHDFRLDDDALILFTSGTTGDPKGVVHTHRTLRARWITLRQSLGLDAYERTLCLLPTHFGHGLICNCLFPWLAGRDLFILPPFSPEVVMRLGAILDEHEITFLSSVPSVWRLALKTAKPPGRGTVRRVFCGSAPLSAHLWSQVREWSGTREVWNSYGITETGSWVAGTSIGDFEPADGLIGVPWGARLAVMTSSAPEAPPGIGERCAPGETGFVWLDTPALMRGYLDRDDLTAAVVSQGWFMTGDLGVLDERGHLVLKGRVREEINKGGMKVYPADIDAVAERFDGVRDMCCFPVEDPFYGQNVGLALVLDDAGPGTIRRLHAWMKEHLAEHQLPVRWYVLAEIPRTSRGKINRETVADACSALDPVDLRAALGGAE